MQTHPPLIQGTVATGFELVEQEFQRNFAKRRELGAACAIYYRGEKVVDLWGGYRDVEKQLRWEEDTLILVFSTTKGVAAVAVAVAHARGLFDYDEKVSTYWAEFAQNGKANITVRQLLSHQAGLCAIDESLNVDNMGDVETVSRIIAQQKPAWEPGTRHGYHAFSLGFYESELIRQVDPQQRTLGQYFRDEVAKPLGLEFYIGLPDDVPASRIATIHEQQQSQYLFNLHKIPPAALLAFITPGSLIMRTLTNPTFRGGFNNREVHRLEIPSVNGIGQVRDIAKAYSELATGGKTLGIRQDTLAALSQTAQPPSGGNFDMVLRTPTNFSLGYIKPFRQAPFGSESAFGHPGAGGSFAFADPKHELAFAYAMNRMDYYLINDPREVALRNAMYRCLHL
ncbi:MAG: serine hydrolase domain-containing protein [Anaerolineae bacterium]